MALDTIPKQEGGKLNAVASGTLPSGQPVVVNADGTVSVVAGSSTTGGSGTPVVFNASSNTTFASTVFDSSNNKIVVAYMDGGNSNYGTAIVGTVSGSSISFGTEVVFEAAQSQYMSAVYDTTNNKIVIAYRYSSTQGRAIVGTVSGTSISFGSPTAFSTSEVADTISTVYDPDEQKVVIAWRDQANSAYCASIVGTVSGTSISFGTKVIVDSANTIQVALAYDTTNNKVVLAYSPYKSTGGSSWWHGYAAVGTVSGTSISWGSTVRFDTNNSAGYDINYVSAVFDPVAEKTVIAYRGNLAHGESRVGTVSGTSISFGAIEVFKSTTVYYTSTVFDSASNSPTIFYRNQTLQEGEFVKGTVSGTSISFDSPITFTSNDIDWISAAFDSSNNKFVTSYRDSSNSGYGTSVVSNNAFTSTNLTAENYIGMSGGVVAVDSRTEEIGSPAVFESADTTEISAVFDSANNKVVIAYEDRGNSNYGTAVVGTVSGTSISFGTPVVFESAESRNISATFDSNNNKVVIAYDDNGNSSYGTAVVGTVSGTSISFGSPVVFESAEVQHIGATFDSSNSKVVIAYADHGNSEYGTAIVGTVSGTSISFGSPAVFESAQTARINSTFDSNDNKVVFAYRTTTGKAVVGTVSGTSISFGTPVEFYNALTDELDIVFDSNANKVVIAYLNGAGNLGLAKVGTVSGTSISFGAEATFESAAAYGITPVFDSSVNKVVVVYYDAGNSDYGTTAVGTIDGTSITFGTPTVFVSTDVRNLSAAFDSSNNKIVTSYRDGDNSNFGTSIALQAGYTNITRGQVANGDNAEINIKGAVADNQSGLTAGQSYYVQTDGTLSTTAGDPSVFAGTAVAATKLIVKG